MTEHHQFLLGIAAILIPTIPAILAAILTHKNTKKIETVQDTVNGTQTELREQITNLQEKLAYLRHPENGAI
jgi:hypothetical protein